jgi:acetoin utilization protein AcuB
MHPITKERPPTIAHQGRLVIRDFMTTMPHSIGRKQSLAAANERMRTFGVRHLPVLEGGRLAGILSQRDVYFVETIGNVDLNAVAVEEAMSVDVYAAPPDAPLLEVAKAMSDHKYGCAVITHESHVVGIFTTTDALRTLVGMTAVAEAKT